MTNRKPNWPYGRMEEGDMVLTDTDKRTIKTIAAIMGTVILSLWLGLMFARGL